MDEAELLRRTRRFAEDAWNRGEMAVVDEVIAPDMVQHGAGPRPDGQGPEAVKEFIRGFRSGMPDVRSTILHELADGDVTVAHLAVDGTHSGALFGAPASGNQVHFELVNIDRFDDEGRIVEHWTMLDSFDLLRQLGAVPEPAAAS